LRPREGNRVGTRVDEEEEIPLLDLLIVPHVKLDDVPIDLWCDAHEVGADRGIVRLRPRLPLQQRHDHGDDGSADDARPDQSTKDTAATWDRGHLIVSHGPGRMRKNSQDAQKGPDARGSPTAAREAYSLYVEPAVEGANEADGPFSSL
jgi:hypothetical protein